MKTVLLPVKDFKDSKQRLIPALDPPTRAGLARAMLRDVLNAVAKAHVPQRVVVFTAADEVIELARPFGFDCIVEKSVAGHSAAVNTIVEELALTSSRIPQLRPIFHVLLRPKWISRSMRLPIRSPSFRLATGLAPTASSSFRPRASLWNMAKAVSGDICPKQRLRDFDPMLWIFPASPSTSIRLRI